MKIAIVYDVPYPWHVGGIEAMHYNAAVELAKTHDVHFFTTKWPDMKDEFVHKGVHYHATHETNQEKIYRNGRRSIKEAMLFNSSVMKLFEHDFDVVITDYFPMLHLPLVKLYCRTRRAKLVIGVAEYWNADYWRSYLGGPAWPMANAFSSSAIRGADIYVTISSTTKEKMVDAGIDEDKVRIFAPVIDRNDLSRALRKKNSYGKTAVFSGRMIKEKRLDKWLVAIKHANEKLACAKGIIIGSGPEKSELVSLSKKLGLQNTVEFRDFYKDKKRFYDLLRRSSVLLNMSEREGLSIICLEAVALGIPVLLPSYSPIPVEVKEMCVVKDEKDISDWIIKIMQTKNPGSFVKNKNNLKKYFVSETNAFYSKLFRDIKAGN